MQAKAQLRATAASQAKAVVGVRPFGAAAPARAGPAAATARPACVRQRVVLARAASGEQVKEVVLGKPAAVVADDAGWVPVCRPEDLPKGVRKEVDVDGASVLLFWYRNQMFAIEGRSPAEGAYSEGFIKAKFTQDYCIECPSTGSLFSLKDGSIVSWYPNNAVLRALTPQATCRPLEIYPLRLTQDAISVDITRGTLGGVKQARDRGGAGTSLENNNVFTVQPTVYFEGMDPAVESASVYAAGPAAPFNPAVLATGVIATGIVAVAGTGSAIYFEDWVLLGLFWAVLGGVAGTLGFRYINSTKKIAP